MTKPQNQESANRASPVAEMTLSGEFVRVSCDIDSVALTLEMPTVHMSSTEAKMLIAALWCAIESVEER